MSARQKGKGRKRRKAWHRGTVEAWRWEKALRGLPVVGTGTDPAEGGPGPLRRVGNQNRGDAA